MIDEDYRSIHAYSHAEDSSEGWRLVMQCGDYSQMPDRSQRYVDTRKAFWGLDPCERCERCEARLTGGKS